MSDIRTGQDIKTVQEVLDRNISAVNARDIEAYLANQKPDVEFVLPGGVTLHGRDQLRQYAQAQWTAFPDSRLAFGAQVLSVGSAAVEVTVSGTHTGPMQTPAGELPPTGRSITVRSVSMLRIEDGLIASEHVYFDQLGLMAQLGLGQPSAAGDGQDG
jgi:steroid delta-isomerase-like uncharacterized protein